MLPALLLFLAATPQPEADVDWQLAQLRTWLSSASRVPGEDAKAPFAGAVELGPGSAKYQEVVALVRRRCALSNEAPPEVPSGHLWEADLDGDGTAERFFTGGCSPEPYFVALQSRPSGWVVWQEGSGALIQVQRRGDEVIFLAARDGYGVERESALTLISIAGWRREFRIVGSELEHQFETRAPPARGETCVLQATALLRSEARVRDAGWASITPATSCRPWPRARWGCPWERGGAFASAPSRPRFPRRTCSRACALPRCGRSPRCLRR